MLIGLDPTQEHHMPNPKNNTKMTGVITEDKEHASAAVVPLMLTALTEHHHWFRTLVHNPLTMLDSQNLTHDALRHG
jgi:hypothetical protein